jgi:hypothetical protein
MFGLQHLRPFQNFVLDFRFQVHEIPIIAAVVSVFGKSPGKVGVIFHSVNWWSGGRLLISLATLLLLAVSETPRRSLLSMRTLGEEFVGQIP